MRGVTEYGKFRNIFLVRLSYLCLQRTMEPAGRHKANRVKTLDPHLTLCLLPKCRRAVLVRHKFS